MGDKSGIEWTDATWNPIRGCSRVSEGCRHCYAEGVAHRFSGPGQPYEGLTVLGSQGPRWNGQVRLVEEHLADPLRWQKPRRIFVNSMSDLFHENVPDEWIDRIFAVMSMSPQHTFQILTKRPERMMHYCRSMLDLTRQARGIRVSRSQGWYVPDDTSGGMDWPLPNVWLGVSIEDQATADSRIPALLQTPAARRFISYEPALGPVSLVSNLGGTQWIGGQRGCDGMHHGIGTAECPRHLHHHHDDRCQPGLDWVICGGESGHGARPMHPDWARSLRNQCQMADVPFFFKQWGEWISNRETEAVTAFNATGRKIDNHQVRRMWPDGYTIELGNYSPVHDPPLEESELVNRVGKKLAGRILGGREWNEMPGAQRDAGSRTR